MPTLSIIFMGRVRKRRGRVQRGSVMGTRGIGTLVPRMQGDSSTNKLGGIVDVAMLNFDASTQQLKVLM